PATRLDRGGAANERFRASPQMLAEQLRHSPPGRRGRGRIVVGGVADGEAVAAGQDRDRRVPAGFLESSADVVLVGRFEYVVGSGKRDIVGRMRATYEQVRAIVARGGNPHRV